MESSEGVLTRSVEKILPSREALAFLMAKRRIRLYQGIDPTGTRLHLGHTIGLRKLMEFADLGHEAILLLGTGTILVGDPSQRDSGRKPVSEAEVQENIANWRRQVEPIVDFERISVRENADWLTKLTLKELIRIASHISALQLFKRDMFQRRIAKGDTVWFHETMYPLLQGYDSVVLDVDLEIGGTDQEFNMLMGRELMKKMKGKEKYVLTTPMIMGTDGQPMSKTSGNCVWLDDPPQQMYGKLMSLPDQHITSYLTLLTDIPLEEIEALPDNPLLNKKRLALEITRQFHGTSKALEAQDGFTSVVQQGRIPEHIEEFDLSAGEQSLLEVIRAANLGVSNAQIKRTITQGGVEWNGKRLDDPTQKLPVTGGEVLRFGKRTFKKVRVG